VLDCQAFGGEPMADAADQKPEWNFGEVITWVLTGDYGRVEALWEMSEYEAIASALFSPAGLRPVSMQPLIAGGGAAALDGEAGPAREGIASGHAPADPQHEGLGGFGVRPSRRDEDLPVERLRHELMRRVQTRKLRMSIVDYNGVDLERRAVTPADATDLEIRVTLYIDCPVAVWCRATSRTAGYSPRFKRTDIVRLYPSAARKTAAATGAILRHLRMISTPQRPLTKEEACQRCSAEVPGFYPAGFKRAWLELEAERKRGTGKHGPRRNRVTVKGTK